MKFLALIFLVSTLSACSHTIKFRASHFAIPITSEKQWGGQLAISGTSVTAVTLVNDYTSNPPVRDTVRINSSTDLDVDDALFGGAFSTLGLDGNLSLLNSLDLYLENSIFGLRWQFLNHGKSEETWVAALQLGVGNRSESQSNDTSGTTASVASKIHTTQTGITVGYQFEKVVPYFSYVQERHAVTTDIDNIGGNFSYNDSGTHECYAIGLTKKMKDLTYAFEYTHLNIDWNRAKKETQGAVGAKIGFAW